MNNTLRRKVVDSHVIGVELGIDPGSQTTGLALWRTSEDGVRILLCAFELEHRAYLIHKKMTQRSGYRRYAPAQNSNPYLFFATDVCHQIWYRSSN